MKADLKQTETTPSASRRQAAGQAGDGAAGRGPVLAAGIPEGWELVTLRNVARVNELTISKEYPFDEIEYIDISSVDKGSLLGIQKLFRNEAPSRAQRIVKDNDILLSTVRPNLKHFAYIERTKPNLIASTGFAVISAKKINPRYLYYYLTTDSYTNFLSAIADTHTSAYPAYNPDVLENSQIPVPSDSNEQRVIAKIPSGLDAQIDLNRRMNETLEQIARAIFKRWFVDFEFPGYEKTKFVNGLPTGWEVNPIGEVLELAYGKALKAENRQSGNVPVYGSNGQVGWHNERLVEGPGIIVGRKGNPGVITWVQTDFFPIDTTFYVIPKGVMRSKQYLFYVLKSQDLASLGADSAVPGLNRNVVYMNEIIIPAQVILNGFDRVIESLFNQMQKNLEQSTILSQIRDSLLPKLMSGEIRVKNKSYL